MKCTPEARDIYFKMYVKCKHKACYHRHYHIRAKRFNGFFMWICTLFSLTSIASWAIWSYVPWVWAGLVILVQIIQVTSPHLPFTKQLVALKFVLPQLDKLLLEIDSGWRNIETYEDKKVNALIDMFQKKYIELDTLYLQRDSAPDPSYRIVPPPPKTPPKTPPKSK